MPLLSDILSYTSEELIYSVFLPFILIFAIIWGILTSLRVFNRKINTVLALTLTIATWYGGGFLILSQYLFVWGAYTGVILFVILFIVGAAFWAFGRGRDIYWEVGGGEQKLTKLNEKIEKLWKEYERTGSETKRRAISETLRRLERERDHLEHEIGARLRR